MNGLTIEIEKGPPSDEVLAKERERILTMGQQLRRRWIAAGAVWGVISLGPLAFFFQGLAHEDSFSVVFSALCMCLFVAVLAGVWSQSLVAGAATSGVAMGAALWLMVAWSSAGGEWSDVGLQFCLALIPGWAGLGCVGRWARLYELGRTEEKLSPLDPGRMPKEFMEFWALGRNDPELAAYQKGLADLGRVPVMLEYCVAREWVAGAERRRQAADACAMWDAMRPKATMAP